ncbi:4-(cytidine 5'-diphospho)-2-C-methyl-D-erythritol kinase [Massilia eurypsychrophila]|uniref:4-diphosphocytidyl-2-C-methyl-D-erythritol kinase n=1 Tax=Massilia eurypsychrophila TaxID=1485217 RepID=A0A2G8TDI4_9BURK|nr:4-(cytidine 5'-diphospho)-2-C-methyl-D-erythritol kinase [Massilia eurypsychrophila]PIL44107.1 4-(cytidine 5'-diphospho)-2-C-methyl-D-erythritol kinase [Massilia eurypsychrophila]
MPPRSLHDCPAPAKLNLFLHVNGRRDDGYHLLQTVFQLVDHGDTLHFDVRDDGQVRRTTDLPGVPAEHDLVVRALRLLQAEFARRHGRPAPGLDVAIDKRLPMGGGLGGGSSDAATALMAANHLWQAGLNRDELMALGLPLGADIPFFIFGQNAFAEGVGERLQPVDTADCWYVVIEPGVAVPTAAIFCARDLTRDTKPVRIADFSRHLMSQQDQLGFGKNDLQAVATQLFPPVAEAVEWLGSYGHARMTGSGSCVFSAFADEAGATAVLAVVPGKWVAWKAKSLVRHPMHGRLQVDGVIE